MTRFLFMGDRRIAMNCLDFLVQLHKLNRLEIIGVCTTPDLYQAATSGLNNASEIVFVSNNNRNEDLLGELIASRGCDVIVSVQHPWILSKTLLESVHYQAFNLHNAELPAFRGFHSVSHALLAGVPSYSTTIHWLSESVDSGDIAYTRSVAVDPHDDAVSLYEKTLGPALELFQTLVDDLLNSRQPPRIGQSGGGRFYSRRDLPRYKDCSDMVVGRIPQIARACYFPPDVPAYIEDNAGRVYLIPENRWNELVQGVIPANRYSQLPDDNFEV